MKAGKETSKNAQLEIERGKELRVGQGKLIKIFSLCPLSLFPLSLPFSLSLKRGNCAN